MMPHPLRKRFRWLLLFYSCVVLFGTLWPLTFRFDGAFLAKKVASIEWNPFTCGCPGGGLDYGDMILNFGMFLPFGVLLAQLVFKGGSSVRAILKVGGTSCLFSLSIEASQLFLPTRTTQVSDLVFNTLGGLAGAASAIWYARNKQVVPRCFSRVLEAFSRQ
jgi:glycopeptide antibiotics resistance protein